MVPAPDAFSNLNLYTVLDSLPDGVTLANRDGRIVFSNKAADRILGVGAATEAAPDEWAEHYGVFLPDRQTPFPTERYPLVRALSGERTQDVEMFIRNAAITDGAFISVSGQPLQDADGNVIGAGVVFRDITELRRTQRKLEETISRLIKAQRMKDELSAFIVHDLKNPLTAITTTCDLMSVADLEDQVQDDVQTIRDAASRIHRMVLDLLDLQMAEDGALELELTTIPLARLIDDVAQASKPRLAASGQRIEVGNAGSSAITADESLVFRVLMNLVDNCAKYGPRDGTVWIDASPGSEGTVVISVRDEGPGVRSDLRERIFEKYAHVEREEGMRSKDSRGLGLRFCKVVVLAHGGRIWVEDAEPRGARFCVEMPTA